MTATKPYALVTGSSRGIGAAIAKELARRGHPVVINYNHSEDKAKQVLAAIEADGGTGRVVQFDVANRKAVHEALEPFLQDDLHIGVIINNAAVVDDAPFPTMSEDAWERVTRTTLDGFYNVTRPLVMPMARKRWGRIVNISSISGVVGNRGQANYAAAKAGLIGATMSLAKEVAKRKVTVNAVAPGLIETDMIKDAPIEEMKKLIPMRRLGTSEEVAALVGFLCSDDAGYITGQVISINGGLA